MKKPSPWTGPSPGDLRGRSFASSDGRRFVALWWTLDPAIWPGLTPAEREVARMIVAGWSNATIAAARDVSPSTVANQARSIFAKLGVSGRAELVARLLRWNA